MNDGIRGENALYRNGDRGSALKLDVAERATSPINQPPRLSIKKRCPGMKGDIRLYTSAG